MAQPPQRYWKRQKIIRTALGSLLLLLLSATADVMATPRTALVIGNAAYQNDPLRNAVHDATDMAAMLQKLGFAVTLRRDIDRRPMQEAIDTFSHTLRKGGVGLFYFAGHGLQVNGENYLIPLGAHIQREQDVLYEGIPLGRILGAMEDAANPTNIIILDACRNNPYARSMRSPTRGLAAVQAVRGSFIAYATAPGATAQDGTGRNGLYTTYLLQHLATPGLSIEQLFKQVRIGVSTASDRQQIPWESSSLTDDFSFAPLSGAPAPRVVAVPPPASPPAPPIIRQERQPEQPPVAPSEAQKTLPAPALPNTALPHFAHLPPMHYRQDKRFQEAFDFSALDYERLYAALFFVTNEIRQRHGSPPLQYHPLLERAAHLHAQHMVQYNFLDHENRYDVTLRTSDQRAQRAGVANPRLTELISDRFGIRYEGTEGVYVVDKAKGQFSQTPGGAVIPPHTYLSFAESLIEFWMERLGKDQILLKDLVQMGCGAVFYQDDNGFPRLKVSQVMQLYEQVAQH